MKTGRSRRFFLKAVGMAVAPAISRIVRVSAAEAKFDPNFGTASEAVRALRSGAISARELTGIVFQRIKKYNPKINAFVTLMEDQAMERARRADEALAGGNVWGRLHGLPVLIKDSFATAGVKTTSGSKSLETYVPKEDAVAVARLKAAGAIIIGKTNLPEFAGDLQTYNKIAGTTNNPWNTARTPGGSTGGGAAALAAGFGFLELGSDIGGSIRTPSHFCGIYGHKPTLNIVPLQGHIPPPPGIMPTIPDLAVAGPMARRAQDLRLELEVLGGPAEAEMLAYRWELPSPRGASLKDYKIGYVLDDSFCPVGSDVVGVLSNAVDALRKSGVDLAEGWPKGIESQKVFDVYIRLLAAFLGSSRGEEELKLMRKSVDSPWGHYAKAWLEGVTLSHSGWLRLTEARLKMQASWQEYFRTHDAFLMPANIVPAFPHDQALTFFERHVATPQGKRLYADMLRWTSFGNLSGCPVTVAPAGRTREGLPVGIQIMGPYMEDATTIDIAGRMADVVGGFEPPPGFR